MKLSTTRSIKSVKVNHSGEVRNVGLQVFFTVSLISLVIDNLFFYYTAERTFPFLFLRLTFFYPEHEIHCKASRDACGHFRYSPI